MKVVVIVKGKGTDFGNICLAENIISLVVKVHPSSSIDIISDQPEEFRKRISYPVSGSLFPFSDEEKTFKRNFRKLQKIILLLQSFFEEKTGVEILRASEVKGIKKIINNADLIYLVAPDGIGAFDHRAAAHEILFELIYLHLQKRPVTVVTSIINCFKDFFSNRFLRHFLSEFNLVYTENRSGGDFSKSRSKKINSLSEFSFLQDFSNHSPEKRTSGLKLIVSVPENYNNLKDRDNYYTILGCSADKIILEKKADIVFIGSFGSKVNRVYAKEKLISCIKDPRKAYFSFDPSFKRVKEILADADLCITSDQYMCALAAKAATPMVLVNADNNMQNLMYDLRMGIYVLNPENIDSTGFYDLILSALNSRERSRNILKHTIPSNVRRIKELLINLSGSKEEFSEKMILNNVEYENTSSVKYIINIT